MKSKPFVLVMLLCAITATLYNISAQSSVVAKKNHVTSFVKKLSEPKAPQNMRRVTIPKGFDVRRTKSVLSHATVIYAQTLSHAELSNFWIIRGQPTQEFFNGRAHYVRLHTPDEIGRASCRERVCSTV